MIEKTHVEGRVVRDENRLVREVEPVVGHVREDRRGPDHLVRDARQLDDEGRDFRLRVDQRLELGDDTAAADAVGPDLRHAARRRLRPGRLHVHDDEVGLREHALLRVLAVELDRRAVAQDEPVVVAYQVGDEHGRDARFQVRELEDDVGDVGGRRAPAAHAQHLDSLLDERGVGNEIAP